MQRISEILSFKNNEAHLTACFKASKIDWDHVVTIASQHLMLPALYCQLKSKNLLSYIPKDLDNYLEEITAINRNRNLELLKEAREISQLFDNAKVEHVFIKGIALIAGNTFNDIGERMIGDVDILIAPHQIHEAFDLLRHHGYTEEISFSYKPKNYRHLSRQINPNKLGAVELHKEVLVHTARQLIDRNLLLKKKQEINGINVPTVEDSIRIAVFTTQINDKAHLFGYLKLKTIYDCLALGLQDNAGLFQNLSEQKQSQTFLELSSMFFSKLKPLHSSGSAKILKNYYKFKINHPRVGHFLQKTFYFLHSFLERIFLFIGNNSYRRHILKNKFDFK